MQARRSIGMFCGLVAGSMVSWAFAQNLPGAEAFLRQANPTTQPQPAAAERGDAFTQRARGLAEDVRTLPADQAAARWLELFDSETRPSERQLMEQWGREDSSDLLMEALPPPPAWDALNRAIDARPLPEAAAEGGRSRRREMALRAFGKALTGDLAWIRANAAELKAMGSPMARASRWSMPGQEQDLVAMLLGDSQPPVEIAEAFAQSIQAFSGGTIQVPDLVTLVGAARAEELLRRALVSGGSLSVEVGDETRRLAQRLGLELIEQLRAPQWSLVTPDSLQLYEGLSRRFTPSTQPAGGLWGMFSNRSNYDEHQYERQQAEQKYLIGLIAAGRAEDAVRLIKEVSARGEGAGMHNSYMIMSELSQLGRNREVYQTLHRMLSENPDLELWDLYRATAVRSGNAQAMLDLARQSAARPGLDPGKARTIRQTLASALIAADQVDEGVAVIESLLADAGLPVPDRYRLGSQLVRIGHATQRPQWVQRGIEAAMAGANAPAGPDLEYSRTFETASLAKMLNEAGRPAEALQLIAAQLGRISQSAQGQRAGTDVSRQLFVVAVQIYHDAGRHQDVLELFEKSPSWGAADLAQLLTQGSREEPIGYIAATALAGTGRNDLARRVLHAMLDQSDGFDPAYAMLIRIDGPNAIAKLDQLYSRDRFEERPLIWKAEVRRTQGQLDEAEQLARQAIAIDPSDGEQPRGDRMRVYAVLAEILAAKGNAQQADFFRGVVRAIRMAEDADRLNQAGLLQRAVNLYQQSLTHFADAYCIQSRLAVQLAELGLEEAAARHYQKAYELMPDSFGRVESHCFGCEGAFRGERAQSIAERVFTRLAAEQPNKPQIHYLLGYLRSSQGRHKDALDAFKRAVQLDPDYLNAWTHLRDLGSHMQLSAADLDSAALAIFRLDPLGRHSQPQLEFVRSLRQLWLVAEAAREVSPPQITELLALPASAARLKEANAERQSFAHFSTMRQGRPVPTPPQAVARTQIVQTLRGIMLSP